jgi:outer membrane protein assembly factor BamB
MSHLETARVPSRLTPWRRRLRLLLACLVSVMTSAALAQENWPSFRGPDAQGCACQDVTASVWNVDKSQNVFWKTPIPGLGHSSPVIWGDRLFITTAVSQLKSSPLKTGLYGDPESADDNGQQQWKVYCLNKKTGRIAWQSTAHEGIPHLKRHPKATHANCTIATDGTNVIAFFGSEGLYCYDLDGHLRWKKDLGVLKSNPSVYNDTPDPGSTALEWGFASSPIIFDQRIFVQCDVLSNGFVAAFNVADGRELWRTPRDDTATWSTPNVCATGAHPQLVVNGWKHMGGYDLETGAELWRLSGGGDCPVPTPVAWHDLIFLMSAHGPRSPIYAVRCNAKGDISLRDGAATNDFVAWSVRRGGAYMQTPMIYGDLLYSCQVDGILSCYEAATGEQLYKERLGSGGDGFTASPVASKGKIYFTSEQGSVFVVKPGAKFNVIATNKLDEACLATPAISDNTLFFRTEGHVLAIAERRR